MVMKKNSPHQNTRDEWETESGLADDVDVWIVGSRFGFLANYKDDKGVQQPLLLWDVESPDADFEYPIAFSIGKGWTVASDGKSVTADAPRTERTFNQTSAYGSLLNRINKDLKVRDQIGGSPRDATIWIGCGFHVKREKVTTNFGESERTMPVAFLGRKAGTGTASKGGSQNSVSDIPAALLGSLTVLAKSMPSQQQFVLAATQLPDVPSNANILKRVMDQSMNGLFEQLRK